MKKILLLSLIGNLALSTSAQVATFESLALSGPNTYWNGAGPDVSYMITSSGFAFSGAYSSGFGGYWSSGWAMSRVSNTTLAGSQNLYAAITATSSGTYLVGQQLAEIRFDNPKTILGLQVTNTTYAYLSMLNGDSFARKFSSENNDFFKLTLYPIASDGVQTASGITVYLADFQTVNGSNFILNTLTSVALDAWGSVLGVQFKLSSSDVGPFGINTPLFFVVDNITVSGAVTQIIDFEDTGLSLQEKVYKKNTDIKNNFTDGNFSFPSVYAVSTYGDYWKGGFAYTNSTNSTTTGYTNLYGNVVGKGYDNSNNYLVGQQNAYITLSVPGTVSGAYVTNTTYAYYSMKDGDAFAKKFGGSSGTDPDFFKLKISGYRSGIFKDSTHIFLADFRGSSDYILDTWKWVSLSQLGVVDSLVFTLSSSDVGSYGINTPLFFALDNLNGATPTVSGISSRAYTSTSACGVYPNPASANIALQESMPVGLEVFNQQGVLQYAGVYNPGEAIYVSDWKAGIYIVRLQSGKACRFVVAK